MSKQDKTALAKGAAVIREAESEAQTSTAKVSWRDHKKIHPACDVFPLMSPERLQELADDIKDGLKLLIEVRHTNNGEYVIDGKNRLDALELLGEQLINDSGDWTHRARTFIHFGGKRTDAEIVAEVAAYSNRRDLTTSQRAMYAAELANMKIGRPGKGANLPIKSVSQSDAATLVGVSESTIKTAKKVLDKAPGKIIEAVKSGKLAVNKALQSIKPKPDKAAQRAARLAELEPQQLELAEQIRAQAFWMEATQGQRDAFIRRHGGKVRR